MEETITDSEVGLLGVKGLDLKVQCRYLLPPWS